MMGAPPPTDPLGRPHSRPKRLIQSITTLAITLTATPRAGAVGGGGLGQMAINYGYNCRQDDVMISTVAAIIVIVQIIQLDRRYPSSLVDHRALTDLGQPPGPTIHPNPVHRRKELTCVTVSHIGLAAVATLGLAPAAAAPHPRMLRAFLSSDVVTLTGGATLAPREDPHL